MIFVTVGTSIYPFDRLIEVADQLAHTGEPVLVQYGASTRPPQTAEGIDFLPFSVLKRLVNEARVAVCHAGSGSVWTCIQEGKKPIVVARRRALGEHVDDHQVLFSQRLSQLGMATMAESLEEVRAAVALTTPAALDPKPITTSLHSELTAYLAQTLTRPR
jgi:UDP-N-acetylglucosamine transferase subunit ALG13